MTIDDAPINLPRLEKLKLKRRLAELCAQSGIALNDTTSPGQMAVRLDPQTQRQAPHLEVIDNELTHMLAAPNARVMVFTPSQIGKSTRVAQWFPFWWLTMRPHDRILMASAEERLALRNGAAVRELVRQFGAEYGVNLNRDEGSKTDWSIRAGGSMRSRGLRGNFSGHPMDLGIIDDPITNRAQAESLTVRDFVWDWYSSVWSQRKSPFYREVLVMCMTGDTPVLMADGAELPLRDVRPGDQVATYENGQVTTSSVVNWKNQGADTIYEITTSSGRKVRANARHPFLVVDEDGTERWVRTHTLEPGQNLRATTATLQLGTESHQKCCSPQPSTYVVTVDEIVSIVECGREDVFDVQIDRTENFIANGIVSHNTRWHPDDLAGRLLARDGRIEDGGAWRVVHLPAIAMPEDHERGVYADPLGREPGDPLTHPLITETDPETWSGAATHREALVNWWAKKQEMSTSRDWWSMSQGIPNPGEGALLTDAQIRAATGPAPALDDLLRVVVAVDPSGGEGEKHDTAGIVAVGLDDQQHSWFLEDRTAVLSPVQWPREVCLLAYRLAATTIVFESNYGGGMAKQLIVQAWDALKRDVDPATGAPFLPADALCPMVKGVAARRNKVLRAEPIAQAVLTGRAKFAAGINLATLKNEFTLWQPGSTWSPGALDAGVYGATEVLPEVPGGGTLARPTGNRSAGPRGASQMAGRRRTA